MNRTPEHVAAVLSRVCRPVKPRTLLSWVEKGLLPPLAEHGRGRAKGKIYYWAERDVVHQAFMVYELLRWRHRTDSVQFMLWLLGYKVSVERWIRPHFLWILEGVDEFPKEGSLGEYGVRLNRDAHAADDPLGPVDEDAEEERQTRLSMLAVRNSERWRHIPGGEPNRRFITDPRVIEIYLNVLLNPGYKPSPEVLDELAEAFPPGDIKGDGAPITSDAKNWAEGTSSVQQWLSFIAQHLSLPRQREAAALASSDEWSQAQRDFQRVLATLIRAADVQGNDVREWGPLRYNLVGVIGTYCILADLALRRAGYVHWVERALLFIDVINHYLDTGSWESAALVLRPDKQE